MDTVHYIDGYKIFLEDGVLYVNDVQNKGFKTPADIVLITGEIHKTYKRHHYTKYEKIYIGEKMISKKVSEEVMGKIKNILCSN